MPSISAPQNQQNSEDRLETTLQRLRKTVQGYPLAIAEFTTSGSYLEGNHQARLLWNLPREAPPNFSRHDCFGGPESFEGFRKACAGELGLVCPIHFRKAGGDLALLRLVYTPLKTQNVINRVIVWAEDLTPFLEKALEPTGCVVLRTPLDSQEIEAQPKCASRSQSG